MNPVIKIFRSNFRENFVRKTDTQTGIQHACSTFGSDKANQFKTLYVSFCVIIKSNRIVCTLKAYYTISFFFADVTFNNGCIGKPDIKDRPCWVAHYGTKQSNLKGMLIN
jgi:hypothetical protein